MSTFTLRPNSNYGVPFSVPYRLLQKTKYFVESEFPTTVMILDPANFAAFRSGQNYFYVQMSQGLRVHNGDMALPQGEYFLVIVNYNTTPTAVHYNVWTA